MERFALFAFGFISILLGLDILDDLSHGSDFNHVALECLAFVISCSVLIERFLRQKEAWQRDTLGIRTQLAEVERQRDEWRAKAATFLVGLSESIDAQFRHWGLTEAERDVGFLILKGLTHKEIAQARKSSENTVRQQAASLYAKSGIRGKSELAAFFLEDLMSPTRAKP